MSTDQEKLGQLPLDIDPRLKMYLNRFVFLEPNPRVMTRSNGSAPNYLNTTVPV